MGAIISKLCCCTVKRRHHFSNTEQPSLKSLSKLSRNDSLIIERTQVLKCEEDGGSEYSRVLEKDFEIIGRRLVKNSKLSNNQTVEINVVERNDSIIKSFQVKHKESGQPFTLTRIKKSSLSKEAAELLCREIRLLAGELPNHPMLVNLYWTWQDEKYLYRVDESDDWDEINTTTTDHDRNTKNIICNFYKNHKRIASQLAVIIHYIHSYGMVHGNINPQSIIIKSDTIKIGSFKYLRKMENGKRLKGICGDLEEFRAPECEKEEYFEEIDWYSYGKVLEYYTKDFKRCDDLIDLIYNLTKESRPRLGYGPAGFNSIQSHPFFINTDWSILLTQKTEMTTRKKYASLSASIESLKSRRERQEKEDGWREFVEFSWEENGEIGQMLETIIKRI